MAGSVYWYLGLSITCFSILISICVQRNTVTTLLMLLIMMQIAYLIETVIYIFLDAYEYHPNIIKSNRYFDSNLGALASNMLAVPTLATLFAGFSLRWWWGLLFIIALAALEELFLHLQIFTQHWWRTYYTSFGLIFYFALSKLVYRKLLQATRGWLHSLFVFLATAPILGTFHIIPIMFLDNRYYHPGWFADKGRNTTAFSSIYYVCSTILIVGLVKLGWKRKWLNAVLLTIVYYMITVVLRNTGILEIRASWDPWYYVLFPGVVYLISEKISSRLKRPRD